MSRSTGFCAVCLVGLVMVTRLAMRRAQAEQLALRRWQDAAERAEAEMQRRIAVEAALRQAQKMEAVVR